jgi:hypothetical protein
VAAYVYPREEPFSSYGREDTVFQACGQSKPQFETRVPELLVGGYKLSDVRQVYDYQEDFKSRDVMQLRKHVQEHANHLHHSFLGYTLGRSNILRCAHLQESSPGTDNSTDQREGRARALILGCISFLPRFQSGAHNVLHGVWKDRPRPRTHQARRSCCYSCRCTNTIHPAPERHAELLWELLGVGRRILGSHHSFMVIPRLMTVVVTCTAAWTAKLCHPRVKLQIDGKTSACTDEERRGTLFRYW